VAVGGRVAVGGASVGLAVEVSLWEQDFAVAVGGWMVAVEAGQWPEVEGWRKAELPWSSNKQ